jgi:hypothetical protein
MQGALREELLRIAEMVPAGSRVLDVGMRTWRTDRASQTLEGR